MLERVKVLREGGQQGVRVIWRGGRGRSSGLTLVFLRSPKKYFINYPMTSLRDAVGHLYQALEDLAQDHEELTDTDVREALAETLNHYFTWEQPQETMPETYFMFSAKGDRGVAHAVAEFLAEALPAAHAEGVGPGQPRHDVLQDDSISTDNGETYDLFIGQSDEPRPVTALHAIRFEPGEYDE